MDEIRPQAGPQTQFLSTSADVAIYGGAAGGGKTFGALLEPLRHIQNKKFGAVFFRRTLKQITQEGGLWDEAMGLYPELGAKINKSSLKFTFPSGARITFNHLQHPDTIYQYQGAQIALAIFDELTHFEEEQFWYIFSRNRSTSGVRPYIRATTNPDSTSWVKEFIAPWVDKDYPGTRAASGEIRYFYRDGGEIIHVEPDEEPPAKAKTLTFIRATVQDNTALMEKDPGYIQNLESLPVVERERLLHGNWDIRHEDQRYSRDWFNIMERRDYPDQKEIVGRVRYWDLAATEKEESRHACFTAGVLMCRTRDNRYIIEDIQRVQFRPGDVKRLIKRAAMMDGKDVDIWIEQEPGAAGKSVILDYVGALAGWVVRGDRPSGSKEKRSRPLEAQAEFGNIYLLKAGWNAPFLQEAEQYPMAHKDQIDAAAGALDKCSSIGRFAFA